MKIKKTWHWFSRPLSADAGEVSVLALAETLIAVTISLGIAWYFETLTHIAVSACLAPALLLRSWRSTLIGLFIFEKSFSKVDFNKIPNKTVAIAVATLVAIVVVPFLALFSKICSTLYLLFTRPVMSIRQIPRNWRRIVLATDFMSPPEVIPGVERLKDKKKFEVYHDLVFSRTIKELREVKTRHYPAVVTMIVLLFIPSIIYRWSLKSTSIIWSPLLWVISYSNISISTHSYLLDIKYSKIHRISRIYSLGVILLFISKISLLFGMYNINLEELRITTLEHYIEPQSLPLWQIGATLNATLSWYIYFISDRNLVTGISEDVSLSNKIRRHIITILSIRNSISIYTIVCTGYITWEIATKTKLPVIKFILFPWSEDGF